MSTKNRILYVPHRGKPVFLQGIPKNFKSEEYLVISPQLMVLYNTIYQTPNAILARYGHILNNIPGDAVFVSETEDGMIDIPEDIIEQLPDILKKDSVKRIYHLDELRRIGATII